MKTGFTAAKLGTIAFIVPFMFIYAPELAAQGSGPAIALAVVTSIIGVVLLAGGVQGYLLVPANIVERLMLIGGGLCMVMPGSATDLPGIALAAAVILFQIMKKRRNSIPA